jgi:hypothetical protein
VKLLFTSYLTMRNKKKNRRSLRGYAVLAVLLACAGFAVNMLEHAGVAPRALGPYLEHRAEGHNPQIEASTVSREMVRYP